MKAVAAPKGYKKTSFTCTKTLFNAALRRARKSRRTMSGHLTYLIEEDLKRAAIEHGEHDDDKQAA